MLANSGTNGKPIVVGKRSYSFTEALSEADGVLTPGRIIEREAERYLVAAIVEAAWTHKWKPTDGVEAEVFARCRKYYGGSYGYVGGRPAGIPRPRLPSPLDSELATLAAGVASLRLAWEAASRTRDATRPGTDDRRDAQQKVDRLCQDLSRMSAKMNDTSWRRSHWWAEHES